MVYIQFKLNSHCFESKNKRFYIVFKDKTIYFHVPYSIGNKNKNKLFFIFNLFAFLF